MPKQERAKRSSYEGIHKLPEVAVQVSERPHTEIVPFIRVLIKEVIISTRKYVADKQKDCHNGQCLSSNMDSAHR